MTSRSSMVVMRWSWACTKRTAGLGSEQVGLGGMGIVEQPLSLIDEGTSRVALAILRLFDCVQQLCASISREGDDLNHGQFEFRRVHGNPLPLHNRR